MCIRDSVRADIDDLDELEVGVGPLGVGRVVVNLVDDQWRHRRQGRGVLRAGRSAHLAAGGPAGRDGVVERLVEQRQRRAAGVGGAGPRVGRAVDDLIHRIAERVIDGDALTAVAQATVEVEDLVAAAGVAGRIVGHLSLIHI